MIINLNSGYIDGSLDQKRRLIVDEFDCHYYHGDDCQSTLRTTGVMRSKKDNSS